ncbi:MAG: C40 family peptidase [Chitinophagales bacterium]
MATGKRSQFMRDVNTKQYGEGMVNGPLKIAHDPEVYNDHLPFEVVIVFGVTPAQHWRAKSIAQHISAGARAASGYASLPPACGGPLVPRALRIPNASGASKPAAIKKMFHRAWPLHQLISTKDKLKTENAPIKHRRGTFPSVSNVQLVICHLFLALLVACSAHGQTNTDYSHLRFMPLDSFYRHHQLDIVQANNCDLFFETYDWLGTPYRMGGRTKSGIDCSDFASVIYNKVYGKTLTGAVTDILKKCDLIDTSQLSEGDLVFFKIYKKQVSHVGVYLGNRRFAHATVHGGVMVNSLDENYYRRYFFGAGRLVE